MTNSLKKRLSVLIIMSMVLTFFAQAQTSYAASYEAESALLLGGAVYANDHTGYSGSGFVGGFIDGNKGNAAAQFTVSAAAAGVHNVTVRYANGNGSAKTLSLYVNGVKMKQTTLNATANWDSWTTSTEALTLAAGSNTIRYKFDTTDTGNVNLDKIDVEAVPAGPNTLEAEAATLTGGTTIANDHTGYTGTGFVGGFTDGNKGSAAVQFAVTPAAAGSRELTFRYSNGTGSDKTLSLYLNGTKLRQVMLQATSNWDTWGTKLEVVTLNAGSNAVRLQFDTTDSGNINLDNLVVGALTTTPTPTPTAAPTPTPTVTPTPTPTVTPTPTPGTGFVYQAEDQFFSGGVTKASTYLQNFTSVGARAIFTVNRTAEGTRLLSFATQMEQGRARR